MPCRFASSGTVATSRSASRATLALNVASNFLRDLVISVLHPLRQSRTLHTLTFGPISGVHFSHHRLRPRQCLSRASATEDDKVVGIRDDVCMERFPAPGQPPVLQEPIHVDVGEQWARDAALGRAARVALATTDAPGPVATILFLDRRLQPQLNQPGHVPVHDATSY